MIPWYWLPIAAILSSIGGYILAAILAASGHAGDCMDCMARDARQRADD